MITDGNGKTSHYSAFDRLFNLADSLGTSYINSKYGGKTVVVYPTPTISTTDDNTLLYVGIGAGVLVFIVAVILLSK